MGVSKMVDLLWKNPIKMDDLGVPPFMETSTYMKLIYFTHSVVDDHRNSVQKA